LARFPQQRVFGIIVLCSRCPVNIEIRVPMTLRKNLLKIFIEVMSAEGEDTCQ